MSLNRFLALSAALIFGGWIQAADHTKDSPATVMKAVAEGKAVLLDVREAEEWKEGHLKVAGHLALSQLRAGAAAEKLKAVVPPGKVVYLHCAAGSRSLTAAKLLMSSGYDIRPLKPGYNDLLKAGFEKAR
ncbi:MAG TPA: rhodanese-like domain-containing protein [Gemmatales bacterium]|nr:rhodanese-like domain-containing protein [Gemmatales bacterium]